ncbi:MAG TPA: ABC transporter permease [Thermoanaerobaculia bacterium]|jgi:putative ABC transport system permease protein|nr:ABC transporter permease [Thermoanaerobaculia bacterium]
MRFYRALLRLYPAFFRVEYRDELCYAFAERTGEISGPLVSLKILLAALADVIPNALAVHWDVLWQDLRYSARALRRTPGFALTAVLVVALGVGANTAVFSVADFVFVRPLPYADSDRLVKLWQGNEVGRNEVSPANYRDWKAMTSSFSGMGAYCFHAANLVGAGDPRRLETVQATPEVLPLLGVSPLIGRVFTARDAGQVVLLSYGFWQSQFGGDRNVIGTTVRLDGVPHTVIGVMPALFQFPNRSIEAWMPLVLREDNFEDRSDTFLEVLARLRPGVSIEQTRRELAVVSARLERQYPKDNEGIGALVLGLRDELSERARLLLIALCGAALCILLLACANLASLFLARGAYRERELAVRSALGAGGDRLVRQLVTETLGIAFIGGVVGVAAAVAGMPLLARLVPSTLPIAEQASLDLRVLAFAAGFVLLTGFVFGLAPALRAGRSSGLDALRGGTRTAGGRTQRLRAMLVVVEVAASVVLLILSGLLIRAVWRIQAVDPGFVADNVLTLRTTLPLPKYDAVVQRAQFYERILEDVRALPGVQSAAYVTGLPMSHRGGIWPVSFTGEEVLVDDSNSVSLRYLTPGYFATLGIPLRRGRDVAATDSRDQPFVAVVSESFVKRYWPNWPNEDPLGKRFRLAFAERTIVGVVGDVRVRGLERPSEPQIYLPYQQVDDGAIIGYIPKDLVVRTAAPMEEGAGGLLPGIREIVKAADPEQPISDVRTMAEIVAEETAPRVTQLRLLGALSAIALLIAGLGIHGLLTFTVSKRAQELGVRRALGAQTREIFGLVLREGLALALAGAVIGVAVGYAAARGMGALLFGVRPEDPLTIIAAAVLCFVTAVAGCLRPAMQAARVDPLSVLRTE